MYVYIGELHSTEQSNEWVERGGKLEQQVQARFVHEYDKDGRTYNDQMYVTLRPGVLEGAEHGDEFRLVFLFQGSAGFGCGVAAGGARLLIVECVNFSLMHRKQRAEIEAALENLRGGFQRAGEAVRSGVEQFRRDLERRAGGSERRQSEAGKGKVQSDDKRDRTRPAAPGKGGSKTR